MIAAAVIDDISGGDDALPHEFGGAHDIGGIDRLVGTGEDHPGNLIGHGGLHHIFDAVDIGLHRLKGVVFRKAYMLEGGRMKDEVHTPGDVDQFLFVPDVTQVWRHPSAILIFSAHDIQGRFIIIQ